MREPKWPKGWRVLSLRLHWGLRNPAAAGGDPVRERAMFQEMCDDLDRRLREWMATEGLLKKS